MKRLNSLTLLAATLLLIGCAEENITSRNNQQQQEEENIPEGLTAFVEDNSSTRTTAEYFDNGGANRGLHFYWTEGDRLWVNTGTALSPVLMQDKYNNINSLLVPHPTIPTGVKRATTAKFYFEGDYNATSYPIRYTGKNNPVGNRVMIKPNQLQNNSNDASHIAESGDCGIATATKSGGRYNFTLEHKAAYITFLPYTSQSVVSGAIVAQIKVTADKAICGLFNFNDNGIDVDNSRPTMTPVNQSITLILNNYGLTGFPIPANTANPSKNSATMVIAPGTYTYLTVDYTLYDPITNVTGIISKTYPNVTLTAGLNKKVSQNLQVTVYPGNGYYMWDAQQHYWAGYEWDGSNPKQPTINNQANSADAPQSTFNTSAHTPRDFNDITGYSDFSGVAPAVLPTTTYFNACPNVNECIWYAKKGDPRWDNTTLWATMGHLCKGGMWFKKSTQIPGFNKNHAPDETIDYTRYVNQAHYDNYTGVPTGKPNNLNDYFYLPARGYYHQGKLLYLGDNNGGGGWYWSSTTYPFSTHVSYALSFSQGSVRLLIYNRHEGFPLWNVQ